MSKCPRCVLLILNNEHPAPGSRRCSKGGLAGFLELEIEAGNQFHRYFGARKQILKHAVTPFPEMETMKADGKEFLVL